MRSAAIRTAVAAAVMFAVGCASAQKPIVSRHGVVSCPEGAAGALLAVEALQCWFPARHAQWRTLSHESHYDVLVVTGRSLRPARRRGDRVALRRQSTGRVLRDYNLRAVRRRAPARSAFAACAGLESRGARRSISTPRPSTSRRHNSAGRAGRSRPFLPIPPTQLPQKSNCALILKNRADMIDNGLRYAGP